ncbi:hypothetical protein GCM10009733_108310 [Nonomuraea maheshkhaliensis]|uniref:Uncharacterized protein n=1 Tax=Nonomuraea maheshkhaliensis TaxID=419590 RepID=A0ABN2HXR2_9ACTN
MRADRDDPATDLQRPRTDGDRHIQRPVRGVIPQQMSQHSRVSHIVDRHDVQTGTQRAPQNRPADPPETIDTYSHTRIV